MKYSQWIGILATLALGIASFLPWTFYPDLNTYFTGFFSHNNSYGKPGKLFIALGAVAMLFFAMNKVWAKRANWLVCAIIAAYALRNYLIFTACYRGICPVKQPAVYVILIAPVVMLVAAFLPKLKSK